MSLCVCLCVIWPPLLFLLPAGPLSQNSWEPRSKEAPTLYLPNHPSSHRQQWVNQTGQCQCSAAMSIKIQLRFVANLSGMRLSYGHFKLAIGSAGLGTDRERGREIGRRTKISGINFVVYFRALSGISQFVWHLNRSSLQLNSTNKSASSCVCRKFQMLELLRAHSLAPPLPRSLCVFYLRSLSAEIWNPNRAT